MEWDDLRYVLFLGREKRLVRAAMKLGVSHSTVGRRVRELEKRLGVRLFDQHREAFEPTASGRELMAVAEELELRVQSLERRVVGRDAELRGPLRVSTMDLLYQRHLPDFATFAAQHPSVELHVAVKDDAVSLTKGEADVALRLTNKPPDNLVGRRLKRVEFAVYASRELVRKVGADAPLSAFPWVHWDDPVLAKWLDGWLAKHARGARVGMRVSHGAMMLKPAIAAGIGVHFLACFEGDGDPTLQRLGPVHKEFGRDVWALTLPALRHTARVRAFMTHLTSAGAPGR